MGNPYQYNTLKNVFLSIHTHQDLVLHDEDGNEIHRQVQVPFGQVKMSLSDVEDLFEATNSVADVVTMYCRKTTLTLTDEQLIQVRPFIEKALKTLLEKMTDEVFVQTKTQPMVNTLRKYTETTVDATHETSVTIIYQPDMFSTKPIFPIRPGAIVNHYKLNYV